MAKYRDFDDDYVYDDDRDNYDDILKKKKSQPKTSNQSRESSVRGAERSGGREQRSNAYREEDYAERPGQTPKSTSGKKAKKKKKKLKTGHKILIFSAEILILLILAGVWYGVSKLEKMSYDHIDRENIVINDVSEDTKNTLKGYTNILLLGSDARDNTPEALLDTETNHTDSIIIASINNETGEVKLVSLYRDTLLYIPEGANSSNYIYTKATEAMFYYGVESTISMINTNMDLDIQDYIMVNWNALIEIIDAVGGIDLEINDTELYWINEYLRDTGKNTGRTYTEVENSGQVHLDGIQATAYCRIRYGGGSDYRRTERQRTVIGLVFAKAKEMGIGKLDSAINAITENIATSLSPTDILAMATSAMDYSLDTETGTTGFPFELTDQITTIPGLEVTDPVVPKNLEQNVSELHKYLFGVENYTPSSAVQNISDKIISMTGAQK